MADTTAAPLPADTYERVKERARVILNHRGEPPYSIETFEGNLLFEEVVIVSEFVTFWRPFIVLDGIK